MTNSEEKNTLATSELVRLGHCWQTPACEFVE